MCAILTTATQKNFSTRLPLKFCELPPLQRPLPPKFQTQHQQQRLALAQALLQLVATMVEALVQQVATTVGAALFQLLCHRPETHRWRQYRPLATQEKSQAMH